MGANKIATLKINNITVGYIFTNIYMHSLVNLIKINVGKKNIILLKLIYRKLILKDPAFVEVSISKVCLHVSLSLPSLFSSTNDFLYIICWSEFVNVHFWLYVLQ